VVLARVIVRKSFEGELSATSTAKLLTVVSAAGRQRLGLQRQRHQRASVERGREAQHDNLNAAPALALAIGVAEHTPLFGCDRLLEDRTGRRMLHRSFVPFHTAVEVPARR